MSNPLVFPDLLSFLPPQKVSVIKIRVTDELYERLEAIKKATGIKLASLGNACLQAIATANKVISFPMHIISQSDFKAIQYSKHHKKSVN